MSNPTVQTFADGFAELEHAEFGIDLVVHSATKALSGHNDATVGVIAGDKTLVNEIWARSVVFGTSSSAFDV